MHHATLRCYGPAAVIEEEDPVPKADPQAFIEKFTRVWAAPEPDAFADLWADGGRLLHPTMGTSIPKQDIPGYVRRLKGFAPDIALKPIRWAARGDDLFIEWTITLTPPGATGTSCGG